MPDWSLFFRDVWMVFNTVFYVGLVLLIALGAIALIVMGAVFLWELIVDWWDDLQAAKRRAQREEYERLWGEHLRDGGL